MKLTITQKDGTCIFEANIVLFDAWSPNTDDGQGHILLDAMHNERDKNGYLILKDQANIDVYGTPEELREFLKNMTSCVETATEEENSP